MVPWLHFSKSDLIKTRNADLRCRGGEGRQIHSSSFSCSWSSWAQQNPCLPRRAQERKLSGPLKFSLKFEIAGCPVTPQTRSLVEDPGFAPALSAQSSRKNSRRKGRDRRASLFLDVHVIEAICSNFAIRSV